MSDIRMDPPRIEPARGEASRIKVGRRAALFATTQLLFWPLSFVAAARARHVRKNEIGGLPDLIDEPIKIRPLNDVSAVVSDEQLLNVLTRLRLRRPETGPPIKVNHVDHALRMWGHEVAFAEEGVLDGKQMLAVLIDDQALRSDWGHDVRPLIFDSTDGIRVRTQEGSATSSHVDHTLATLTEIGLPLSKKIRTRNGIATVGAMLRGALRTFTLNQKEYEWTALAWAMYSNGQSKFRTKDGQLLAFDLIASRMMRESLGHGVCYGGHRLFTLAMLRRIDEVERAKPGRDRRLFSDETRQQIHGHLSDATRRLTQTQHADGYWDDRWPGYAIPSAKQLWTQGARLVSTGHALEWWAMVSDDSLLPPRESIVRAGQWLVREIEQMEEATVMKNYTFLTHAGRALSLWRGELPADSWNRLSDKKVEVEPKVAHKPATLWSDERGAILSIELIILATIACIGLLAGLSAYRDAIVQEIGDSAASVASLTQSFDYEGVRQSGSFGTGISEIRYESNVEGSSYTDTRDFCEAVLDASASAPMCIELTVAAEDEQ